MVVYVGALPAPASLRPIPPYSHPNLSNKKKTCTPPPSFFCEATLYQGYATSTHSTMATTYATDVKEPSPVGQNQVLMSKSQALLGKTKS